MPRLVELIDEDAARISRFVDLAPFDRSSVMVLGASGLLGIYVLACLRRRVKETGQSIRVIAVALSPPPVEFTGLFEGPNLRMIYGDLTNYNTIQALPDADYVIHVAGYGQPGKFLENPSKTIEINTSAVSALLEKLPSTSKFLFVSSSEIYSGSSHIPHQEGDIGTTTPDHPRACYIEGKRCGEAICHAFRAMGRDIKVARLALAYGPGTRADDQRVLNSLIRRALLERQVSLLDQGAARRTYVYVTDAIEMIFSILLYGRSAVYNVGGRSSVTILQLAQTIGRIVGVPVSTPAVMHELAGAPSDVVLDLSRFIDEFEKKQFVAFEEGITRTIAWQRELYAVTT